MDEEVTAAKVGEPQGESQKARRNEKVSWGEHYLKLVEAWVLAVGIFAFGGFAYHTPMIKADVISSWKPVAYICFVLGFTVIWAAVDIFTDLLAPRARGKKLALAIGFVVSLAVLAPAIWFSAILAAQWADNNARIDWCRNHPYSTEPLCKPLRD